MKHQIDRGDARGKRHWVLDAAKRCQPACDSPRKSAFFGSWLHRLMPATRVARCAATYGRKGGTIKALRTAKPLMRAA